MARFGWSGLAAALVLALAAGSAGAQAPADPPASSEASGPIYVVTYFEVAPAASRKTAGLLRQFSSAARNEAGNVEFLALHEITRPGRFAFVEAWQDKAAFDLHGAAMKALADKLEAAFASPFDARQFRTLSVAGPTFASGAGADGGAVLVLTHVDVFPAGKDEVAALIRQEADDSRKDRGALRFDAMVQDAHPNHFHLVEAWSGAQARAAHALTDHTRQFRAKLVPFEGALYDERLYQTIR